MNKKLLGRFEELTQQLAAVLETKYYEHAEYSSGNFVDDQKYRSWVLKAKNLLDKSCGEGSLHFQAFNSLDSISIYDTNYDQLLKLQAVFEAAKEDFAGGYCSSIKNLVQAEVFDSELEQARALFEAGYHSAAAVIAGVVLETSLRQLCDNHNLPHGKLNKMNSDLAKVGQYNKLRQKQITALADIRNSAAHGDIGSYTEADVDDMIAKIEAFVADALS